jgi:hypothetical protein
MRVRRRSFLSFLLAWITLSSAVVWQASHPAAEGVGDPVPALPLAGPRFWKGNLHTHSLWSDGDDFPEMIADWYKRQGYHFLALTDHNTLADGERWADCGPKEKAGRALPRHLTRFGERWVERRGSPDKPQVRLKPLSEYRSALEEAGRYLLLPAEEISHRYAKAPMHINAVNLRDAIKPVDGSSMAETIAVNHRLVADQARRTGWRTIAVLNHPNFQWGIRAEDVILTEEVRFFEVFNGHPVVHNYGDDLHASTERLWDIVLALRLGKHRLPPVFALATDDAHGYHEFGLGKVNPGRGWVMVRAPYLSAEAVVRAMVEGDFYASTGVVLTDVRRRDGQLQLTIRAEEGVTYRTEFIATLRSASLASEPQRDGDGKEREVTRLYSTDIGKVVAVSEAREPSYRLTGEELYVRAKVTSSKRHPNPYQKGDLEVAWTQPLVP